MNALSATSTLIPLPGFPQRIDRDVPPSVGLRRFGIFEGDLGIDFASANRAALVTRLLETCAIDPTGILPDSFFLELAIGKRIECLLLLAAGGLNAALGFPFKCVGCGEEIELELTRREISEMQSEADLMETVGVDIDGRRMEFRKPTGRDQEMWSRMSFSNERDAAVGIIGTLAELPGSFETIQLEELSAVEEVLDEVDPLVDFSCSVSCGECGTLNEHEIDLMETALGMLNRAQNQLVVTVHRLASHYHWSEKEIFAVPDRRRQQYLELIGAIRK
ncbi:MAG: hypothetical protein ABFR90_11125 [Planctomycetota bacterium]